MAQNTLTLEQLRTLVHRSGGSRAINRALLREAMKLEQRLRAVGHQVEADEVFLLTNLKGGRAKDG